MLPDRVSNPGPLTYESGALPIALRRPAKIFVEFVNSVDSNLAALNDIISRLNEIFVVWQISHLNDLLYRINDRISRLNEIFVVWLSVLTFLF